LTSSAFSKLLYRPFKFMEALPLTEVLVRILSKYVCLPWVTRIA
jgi:hypothetical protein